MWKQVLVLKSKHSEVICFMLNRWHSSYKGVFSVYTHQKLNILIFLNITIRRSFVVTFQSKNNVSKQPDLKVFSTAQEAPAGWTFASKYYICLLSWTYIVAPRLASTGDRFKKNMRDWSLDLLSFSFPWSDSYRLVAFTSEINTVNTLVILVHPIEHNCKDSSVTFVSKCWQRDDSDKLNLYWSRSCCIQ